MRRVSYESRFAIRIEHLMNVLAHQMRSDGQSVFDLSRLSVFFSRRSSQNAYREQWQPEDETFFFISAKSDKPAACC